MTMMYSWKMPSTTLTTHLKSFGLSDRSCSLKSCTSVKDRRLQYLVFLSPFSAPFLHGFFASWSPRWTSEPPPTARVFPSSARRSRRVLRRRGRSWCSWVARQWESVDYPFACRPLPETEATQTAYAERDALSKQDTRNFTHFMRSSMLRRHNFVKESGIPSAFFEITFLRVSRIKSSFQRACRGRWRTRGIDMKILAQRAELQF